MSRRPWPVVAWIGRWSGTVSDRDRPAGRRTMVAVVLTLALTVFHVPTVLTGRVFVSDAPVPEALRDVVAAADDGIRWNLEGLYGLRFAGLACDGATYVAFFDVLGPFAPIRAIVASSTDPWGGSDPTWQLRVPALTREHPDAASIIPPDAGACRVPSGATSTDQTAGSEAATE